MFRYFVASLPITACFSHPSEQAAVLRCRPFAHPAAARHTTRNPTFRFYRLRLRSTSHLTISGAPLAGATLQASDGAAGFLGGAAARTISAPKDATEPNPKKAH